MLHRPLLVTVLKYSTAVQWCERNLAEHDATVSR